MSREPILVFDIETVPDLDGFRRIHDLGGVSDAEAWAAMKTLRLAQRGSEFQPAHLQRVVAISAVLRMGDSLRCWSVGEESAGEGELIQRFFDGIDKYRPVLVSWNGSGFDLPVLQHRALIHAVQAPRYWDTGQNDREARWDNYLGRYQFRHTDLMDVLALYTGRNNAPLHEVAVLLGLPGKLGLDGSQVFETWLRGGVGAIRAYCETDVMNTWLVYLRFMLMRGALTREAHAEELARVRASLEASAEPHWREFLDAWRPGR